MIGIELMNLVSRAKLGKFKYYHVGFPFYEIYQDGLYLGMHNGCMVARKKLSGIDEGVLPIAPKGKEGYELKIPKIPFKYWYMIWTFYRDINIKYGTEAAVLLYWNNGNKSLGDIPKDILNQYGKGLYVDGKLVIYAPKQVNTKVSTKYYGDPLRDWLDSNMSILLDTHSHNSMGAFFSSTDDANEKRFQFYAVYGNVGSENTFIMRYRFQDSWFSVEMSELFEEGEIPEGKEGKRTYPEGWLEQCTFQAIDKEREGMSWDVE